MIASVLISFVPCSARSAIILAIAGKYLGAAGVVGMFALTLLVIAVAGRLLSRRGREPGPRPRAGHPRLCACPGGATCWPRPGNRTSDILTIVTPLLVGGSVLLALLGPFRRRPGDQYPADAGDGLVAGPAAGAGRAILFGVLRKELSLLMIYQATGHPGSRRVLAVADASCCWPSSASTCPACPPSR
jgi:ferrous iron transport protein B